ncbi:dioxygenase family protein [Arthrobacter sp. YN]|uniref:dioxygenase family protein n=1 Tax=Arthrobacter sp. YN TaxID=2020486 RepID=UPI000B5EF5A9|nr:dioxygenase [Arthrobacter sp. YN]ASN20156.1 6-chlorohydroxyquinol-1,2-dioxygenase [Arthrobacter sp. YN]
MAENVDGDALTSEVVRSFSSTSDERLRQILTSLTTHLHAFVVDVAPSIEEWEQAVDFLSRTGQACTDVRQEFILLSDVLGVSMLVETLNGQETPEATDSTVLGPFHMVESPARELGDDISPESEGPRCVVSGRIRAVDGTPIPNAAIDIWQADTKGFYDVQQPAIQSVGNGRALLRSDAEGRFHFRSVIPMHYPIPTDGPVGELLKATSRHPYRPAHIHFLVTAPGFRELTTHIFIAGSDYIDSDAVFAVKGSLVKDFVQEQDGQEAERYGVPSPFRHGHFDIVLHPES